MPAGSGNGLSKSLTALSQDPPDATCAMFGVVKGHTRKMDMFACLQPGLPPRFGFLSISWAIITQIDIESERCRCCGSARFTFAGLLAICCLKRYPGVLQWLPDTTTPFKPKGNKLRPMPDLKTCALKAECKVCKDDEDFPSELESLVDLLQKGGGQDPPEMAGVQESAWETAEGDFTSVWAMNVPWAAIDSYVAPRAHLADGTMDLTFIRKIGRSPPFCHCPCTS